MKIPPQFIRKIGAICICSACISGSALLGTGCTVTAGPPYVNAGVGPAFVGIGAPGYYYRTRPSYPYWRYPYRPYYPGWRGSPAWRGGRGNAYGWHGRNAVYGSRGGCYGAWRGGGRCR